MEIDEGNKDVEGEEASLLKKNLKKSDFIWSLERAERLL
jgi:hypothetical protein